MSKHDHHDKIEQVAVVTKDGKAMADTAPTRNKTIVSFAVISMIGLAGTQYALTSYLDSSTQSRHRANLAESQADAVLWIERAKAYDSIGDFERACVLVQRFVASGIHLPPGEVDVDAAMRARLDQCTAGQNPPLRAGRTPIADAMTRVVSSVGNRNSIAVIAPQRSATSEQGTPWTRLAEAPSWYPQAVHTPAPAESAPAAH